MNPRRVKMKKCLMAVFAVLVFAAYAGANGFLTLGYDYGIFGKNDMLGTASSQTGYFNLDGGYLFDNGLSVSFKYDHIDMEDFSVIDASLNSQNVKVVAVVPSLGVGYTVKFMDGNLLWWSTLNAGYAVSVRYRLNVTDYHAMGFAPSVTTALYYKLGKTVYGGVDLGYRYLKVTYDDFPGKTLDLSGMFCGISIKHIFE